MGQQLRLSEVIDIYTINVSNHCISELKFSPKLDQNRFLLACGCHDRNIYVYAGSLNVYGYKLIATCEGHQSFVNHFDFGTDPRLYTPGEPLKVEHLVGQSSDGAFNVRFWQFFDKEDSQTLTTRWPLDYSCSSDNVQAKNELNILMLLLDEY